jgi:hypothetical protein
VSFLGWRQWAIDRHGLLRPAWTPWSPYPPEAMVWRPEGLTEAVCLRVEAGRVPDEPRWSRGLGGGALGRGGAPGAAPHPAVPEAGCVCGLYAWDSPDALAAARRPRWTSFPVVVGVARLGGRVIVTERGYRAQRGLPVAVLDPRGDVSDVYALARYRTWDALVAEWHDRPPTDDPPDGSTRLDG